MIDQKLGKPGPNPESDSWLARSGAAEMLCRYVLSHYVPGHDKRLIDPVIVQLAQTWSQLSAQDTLTRLPAAEDLCRYVDQHYLIAGDMPPQIPPGVDITILIYTRKWVALLSM